jgi:ATP-binding cassette subfamily B protein
MRALRRLLPYYRPYIWQVVAGLAFVVISSAFASVTPWLLRAALDGIGSGAPSRRIWTLAAGMVGLALVAGVLRYGMRELINGLSRRIEYDLRNDLFAHLMKLDAAYFGRTRTGDIMARLTNDLNAVRQAVGPAIMYFTNTVAGAVFALYFMLRIDVRLTLLALTPMVLLPVLTMWLGRAIHTRFEAVQEHFSTMTTRAQENLAGARIVRAYRQERAELDRFAALNDEYLTRNMALVRLYGVMNPAFGLLAGLGAVTVLGVGGILAARGTITIGAFVAFGLYLGMLTWPLIALGWVVNLFQRGAASTTRLVEVLDQAPTVADPPAPAMLPAAASGRSVEFRGVGFHYPSPGDAATRWVLRDISFRVDAGATLAVVGATGSGKSALLELLARVYDPQEGHILIDGVPIQSVMLDQLRREIGFVRKRACCSVSRSARTSRMAPRTRRRRNGPRASRNWTARSPTFPAGTRRCSENAGSTCQVVRNSARRWLARSHDGRRSSCSTMRCRLSTHTQRRTFSVGYAKRCGAGRRSLRRTV